MVFLTHNYPRQAGDLPGAFLHPLALALRERGHDVRVVAPAEQGRGGRERLDGIPINRVRYSLPDFEVLAYDGRMREEARSPSGLVALAGLLLALYRGARDEEAGTTGDVVFHAHWWFPSGLALPGSRPGVVTLHGTDVRLLETSAIARRLGRRVLRRARVVTAVSSELAVVAERVSGRQDVTRHVQPMPVPGVERPWSNGGGGALVVARLVPQKRVELAIAAAGELAKSGESIALTIVGHGPEREKLVALAAQLPPEATVRFMGTLPPEEVARQIAAADVMLFPAVGEGLGLAGIEALMAGVPVIACSDGGGIVSALARHGGGVVTAPSARALASALRDLQVADQRDAARQAGAEWRAELEPARVAERFEGWYAEALHA